MSLRILFADDSVTAQNMGKKILTEAGYDVVAVSNGAAAVKKIAEQKPDIIILDVYMPGYTGLEVCEKVRGSIETLKTPVLLTVGKMEPYKPEEANRVRADGVIVKPFEASDLLAIVKKFEERIGQAAAPPLAQRSIAVDRFNDSTPPGLPPEYPEPPIVSTTPPQATVEVPDHMATTSAFSDLLGVDPSRSLDHFNVNQSGAAREVVPRPLAHSAPIPDYELPVSWGKDVDARTVVPATLSPAAKDAVAQESPIPSAPTPLRPRQIPVYQDREEVRSGIEVVPTAAHPTGEIEIAREPHLEETAAETTRNTVVDSKEPGLVPTLQDEGSGIGAVKLAPVESRQASADPQETPSSVAGAETSELPPGPRLVERAVSLDAIDTKLSESDFEVRVAAAMAAYTQANASRPAEEAGAETSSAGATKISSVAPVDQSPAPIETAASGTSAAEPDPLPTFEYQPPVGAAKVKTKALSEAEPPQTETASSSAALGTRGAPQAAPDSPGGRETATVPDRDFVLADLEAVLPAAAAAAGAETGSGHADHSTIAQAVHRVIERLKPELVEEIVRELKNKK